MRESTFKLFERVAEVSGRPVLYQIIQAIADEPEHHLGDNSLARGLQPERSEGVWTGRDT